MISPLRLHLILYAMLWYMYACSQAPSITVLDILTSMFWGYLVIDQ